METVSTSTARIKVLSASRSTTLRTPVEPDYIQDDVDVYLVRAGAETFERPMDGGPDDWVIGESPRKAYYVTLSQIVAFPEAELQSQLVYRDWERRVLVGVPTGYGVMQLLPDAEVKKLRAAMSATRRRR
jgi:hypothetical protein